MTATAVRPTTPAASPRTGAHRAPAVPRGLRARVDAVRTLLDDGGDAWSPDLAAQARGALDRVEARLALGVDRTVVALVGGTGSGKSSLFNAISGLAFAAVGDVRPTTSRPAACVWGAPAEALVDELGIPRDERIRRESALDGPAERALDGLVLLDLTDTDSIRRDHAVLVDRLLPRTDLVLWVVDPQKYADAVLHEQYLAAMSARQDAMVVLVNQVDTVRADGAARIVADVRRLLAAAGLGRVPVLTTSAVTRQGVADVRALLARTVAEGSAAARLAAAEVDAVVALLRADLRPEPGTGGDDAERLDAAADAAVDRLVTASGLAVATATSPVGTPGRAEALQLVAPPTVAAADAARDAFLDVAARDLRPGWARAVADAVADAPTLKRLAAAELARVSAPQAGTGRAWRLGAAASAALALVGLGTALVSGTTPTTALAVVAGVLLALGCLLGIRWSRARAAALGPAAYATQVHVAMRSAVDHLLTRPATQVRLRHRALSAALVGLAGPPQVIAGARPLTGRAAR